MAGSTANPANWIGIVDLPDGQYRLEHGLVVTEDTGEAPPQPAQWLSWQSMASSRG